MCRKEKQETLARIVSRGASLKTPPETMSKKRPLPTGSTDLDLDKEYDTYVRTFWDRELERVKRKFWVHLKD